MKFQIFVLVCAIRSFCQAVVDGDSCDLAVEVTIDSSAAGSAVGASLFPSTLDTDAMILPCWSHSFFNFNIYFKVIGNGNKLGADLCNEATGAVITGGAMMLAVEGPLDSSCDFFAKCVQIDEVFCVCPYTNPTKIVWFSKVGVTYFVIVFTSEETEFTLDITDYGPPKCTATPIDCTGFNLEEIASIVLSGDVFNWYGNVRGCTMNEGWEVVADILEIVYCASSFPGRDGKIHVIGQEDMLDVVLGPVKAFGYLNAIDVVFYDTDEKKEAFLSQLGYGVKPSVIYAANVYYPGVCCEQPAAPQAGCPQDPELEACVCSEAPDCCGVDWTPTCTLRADFIYRCCSGVSQPSAVIPEEYALMIDTYVSMGGGLFHEGILDMDWFGSLMDAFDNQSCDNTVAALTSDGNTLIPTLTNVKIESARCRYGFDLGGQYGNLQVVAEDGDSVAFMLGGTKNPFSGDPVPCTSVGVGRWTGKIMENVPNVPSVRDCCIECVSHGKCELYAYKSTRRECKLYDGHHKFIDKTDNGIYWVRGELA